MYFGEGINILHFIFSAQFLLFSIFCIFVSLYFHSFILTQPVVSFVEHVTSAMRLVDDFQTFTF